MKYFLRYDIYYRERERESRCRSMFRRVFKVHHTLERLLASSVLPARFSAFPPSLCNCTKVFASTEAQWSRSPLAEKHRHIKFNKPLNLNIFHLASRHFHLAFPISICHQHCGGVASWFMVYGFPKWFPILRCLSRSWEQKVLTEKQPIWIQSASIGKSICGHFWNKTISSHFFFGFLTVLFRICRARGYPEPIVTWRREDGNEIVLKDNVGTKTLGKYPIRRTFALFQAKCLFIFPAFSFPHTCSALFSRRGTKAIKDLEERDGLLSVHRLQRSTAIGLKAHLPQHTLWVFATFVLALRH